MSELLNGIRIIKYFCWENSFIDKINGIRKKEIDVIKRSILFRGIGEVIWVRNEIRISMKLKFLSTCKVINTSFSECEHFHIVCVVGE